MKRELAALETNNKSPKLDSIGRITRSSKGSTVVGCSEVFRSLVYKRVKRPSNSVEKAEVLSNGVNKVVEECSGKRSEAVVGCRRNAENVSPEVEKRENGVAVGDEGVNTMEDGASSFMVVEAKEDANGSSLVGEDGLYRNGVVVEVAVDSGMAKNVQPDGVEVMPKVDNVVESEANANGDCTEVDKGEMAEGVLTKSSSKIVNGNVKNGKVKHSSVERYPRRFTRSALKSKADTMEVENGSMEGNGETMKAGMNEGNGEVCKEIVLYEPQMTESRKVEVKNSLTETYTRRLTRSAKKPKVDSSSLCSVEPIAVDREMAVPLTIHGNFECDMDRDDEELSSATPRRKLEMKMSKHIAPAKIPSSVQELFETGLLEGCPVYYDGGKGPKLHGRVRGIGILCSCGLCRGGKVIPPSLFEIHACNTYKRAVQYIYLENGRSLIQILKTCKSTRLNTLEATVQNAIGPLPEKKFIVCQNCNESFSTMDGESSEQVCSTCVMSNLSPIGPVYSTRKRCRSSKFFIPSRAASACDLLQDSSQNKSVEKSADAFLTPKLRSSPRAGRFSETKMSEEIINRSQEPSIVPKIFSPVMGKISEAKRCKTLKKRSFKAASFPRPSRSTQAENISPGNDGAKATERLRKELLSPKPPKTSSALRSSEKKTNGKITRKDLRLHKLVFEDDVLPDGTELGYYARGQKLLEGFKQGFGIFCNCCDTVVSASQFEAHAGCASRRKPYCYIYTSNGVSLHELSVTLIKDRLHSAKYNDDLCSICADGGNLLLCDGCPRAFHKECASLPSIPRGKWYCKYCENMFEREKFVAHNANALAAGRVSGIDPIEQITKRSIRIVNNLASEVSACILCRGHDFCKSGFGPRTIILCDQCEKEYHVGCLKDHNMADLMELPDGKWFCSMDCGRIESSLENLLERGVEKLPDALVDTIQKKNLQNGSNTGTDLDVSWRLLSGKIASPETRPLLSQAVAIFHESFAPIIDVVSGHDLIPAMVYGRNVGGQEYGGMYCAVLTVNSVVVSAAIFRIFGPEVAELPLVATSSGNHGKGYFQTLFACIERLLTFLKIKTLVLPAAEEAGSIWKERFGFTKMTADQLRELKRNFWSIVRFQGTSMLHKLVPECHVIESS